MAQNVSVFISSTCYDLADLRRELRHFLESNGFVVSLSEDPFSSFFVEPTGDSITSCLRNVEAADAVVCVLNQRYGGIIRGGEFDGISATHAEIRHAWGVGKPVYFFARRPAWDELQALRREPAMETKWVEPTSGPERKAAYVDFFQEISRLVPGVDRSNWIDIFDFSTDLKPLVLKRLIDRFPDHDGAVAMRPERLVRIHFEYAGHHSNGAVAGHFRNVGIGPAMNIVHGVKNGDRDIVVVSRGALGEGESLLDSRGKEYLYQIPPNQAPALFCEYDNRFGDRYRVEVPLAWTQAGYETSGGDKFYAVSTSGYR